MSENKWNNKCLVNALIFNKSSYLFDAFIHKYIRHSCDDSRGLVGVLIFWETEPSEANVRLYDAIRSIDLKINIPKTKVVLFDRDNELSNFIMHKWWKLKQVN